MYLAEGKESQMLKTKKMCVDAFLFGIFVLPLQPFST